MRRICLFLLLVCLPWVESSAEVVTLVLQTGKTMSGELVMENEQVIVIQDTQGRRFQYPMTEIGSVQRGKIDEVKEEEEVISYGAGKVATRLNVGLGAVTAAHGVWGTDVMTELQIGTRNLASRRIFLGGSIGYHGVLLPEQKYHYIPLQVVVSVPLLTGKHAPELGMGIGYGFSAHHTRGGICADVQVGYRYAFSSRGALLLSAYTRFQQDCVPVVEEVENKQYTNMVGRNMVSMGLRLGLQF